MPFWVKPIQMGMGCSLVRVAHAILVQTSSNGHGLLFSVGCSYQYTHKSKDTEPTLIDRLLGLLMGCSVAF